MMAPEKADRRAATVREAAREGTIHFMGVGGAGMCALAEAVVRGGGRVTGCDLRPGAGVRALERLGVRVLQGHGPSHVREVEGVVFSAAIPGDHPELAAARAQGIPVWKRARALGDWVNAGRVAAVAGTHGKTTTTALLTGILVEGGEDPTGFVGGEVPAWKSHLRSGRDDFFVVEADEYDRSFHHLRPDVTVVTNMEADHLDIYGSLEGVREGFHRYLEGVKEGGSVVVCADDPGASSLLPRLRGQGRSYGLSAGSQLRAVEVEPEGTGSRFRVMEDGRSRGLFRLWAPGVHNVRNALGAAAAARALGVDWASIRRGVEGFQGVHRRFQELGAPGGVAVVDDYAHHPSELSAALAAARARFPGRTLVAVFQPHLYSRTQAFHAAFGEALAGADRVWVTSVYPAREAPIPGVEGTLVAEAARRAGARVTYHPELDSLPSALAGELAPGEVCLLMGAGSIERVGPALVELLQGMVDGERVGNAGRRGVHG